MEYSGHKETTDTDELYCVNCGSKHRINTKGKSGWNILSQCKSCGWKHNWSCNDMASGASHHYTLLYNGSSWDKDSLADIISKLDVTKNMFYNETIDKDITLGVDNLKPQSPETIKSKYFTDNLEDIIWLPDGYWYNKRQVLDQTNRK